MSKISTRVTIHTVNDLTNHYRLSEIVIWLWDIKKILKNYNIYALLSLFLTVYHIAWVFFSQPKIPNLNVPYFECHWMHVQLRHICQPQTWSHQDSQALCILDNYLPFGVAPPGFQPGLAACKKILSSIPPTFPFTVCKLRPSARGMVLVALTAEYQECLKAGPFDVHYQCISAWWHCDCSTRMRCVDTFCWHLSHIYIYREDAWNVPVS